MKLNRRNYTPISDKQWLDHFCSKPVRTIKAIAWFVGCSENTVRSKRKEMGL